MKKKMLIVLLACSLLVTVLTGCEGVVTETVSPTLHPATTITPAVTPSDVPDAAPTPLARPKPAPERGGNDRPAVPAATPSEELNQAVKPTVRPLAKPTAAPSLMPSHTPNPAPTAMPFATVEPSSAPAVPDADVWNLVFEDNFDFFDRTKWKVSQFRHGIRRAAFYVDDGENVFTENGNLILRTNYRNGPMGEGWYSAFIDSSINNNHHRGSYDPNIYKGFTMNRGYIECRCKVPAAEGVWSAFWLFPDQKQCFGDDDIQYDGSDGAELDIMESLWSYRSTPEKRNRYKTTIHIDGYDEPQIKSFSSPYISVDMYNEFHTYGMLWEDDKYTFFLDGEKTWETSLEKDGKVCGTSRVPEFIILSMEVQGTEKDGVIYPGLVGNDLTPAWNGNPDNNDKTKNYDMVVDYVRCYEKGE